MTTTDASAICSPPTLSDQTSALADLMAERRESARGVVLAGVSGGATLGLALALHQPEAVDALVLHEPLVGPAAPELHAAVSTSAAELGRDGDVAGFLRRLVGDQAWSQLSGARRDAALANADAVRAEVPSFATFAPDIASPTGTVQGEDPSRSTSITTTVGERSAAMRHEAASLLADLLDASVVRLPRAGHLVQFERPDAWAACIATVVDRLEESAP